MQKLKIAVGTRGKLDVSGTVFVEEDATWEEIAEEVERWVWEKIDVSWTLEDSPHAQ